MAVAIVRMIKLNQQIMKRFYEFTYLVKPSLGQEEVESFDKKVKEAILSFEGEIKNELRPKKINLAYPIEKYSEAYLLSLDMNLPPEKINDLKDFVLKNKEILRYIVFKKKPPKTPARKPPSEHKKNIKKTTKVELKEIDKKLEEILKQ